MSINRQDFGVTFDVYVGTAKALELTIIDPDTGLAKDLSDTNVYATGIARIFKVDGTQIGGDMNCSFTTPRTTGIITFTVTSTTHTLLANAGNWIGKVIFKNVSNQVIDQQKFNLNILE